MKNITAYNIAGKIYFREGRPSEKKKIKLRNKIAAGEKPEKWIYKKKDFKKARATKKGTPSEQHKKEEITGDLITWLQI